MGKNGVDIDEREFIQRFVIGRVFLLVPAFLAVLTLAWIANQRVFWIMFATHVGVLAFTVRLARRSAPRHLNFARELGSDIGALGVPDNVRSHLLPLAGACLIVGIFEGFARHDWRWLLLTGGLAGLLGAGLLIRWVIFDRWLLSLVSSSSSDPCP